MAEKEEKKAKVKRPTPLKRDLQNEKRRLRNKAFKSSVRSAIRRFDEAVPKGDVNESNQLLNAVYSIMDKGVKHGIFKQNKANRTKARLAARAAAVKA
jgi:small subunit ribosomal protein S20